MPNLIRSQVITTSTVPWCSHIHTFVFITWSALLYFNAIQTFGQDSQPHSDPVQATIAAYKNSVEEIRANPLSPEEKLQWRQDWLERMLAVAPESTSNTSQIAALETALGLSNALSRFELSRQILANLIELTQGDSVAQSALLTELGEVNKMLYLQTRSEDDKRAAIKALTNAIELLDKTAAADPTSDVVTSQIILNLNWIGELQTFPPTSDVELNKAATSFRRARQLLETLGEPQGRLVGTGFTLEQITGSEIVAAARSGKIDDAISALSYLSTLPNTQWPPSMYAANSACIAFPERTERFRQYIELALNAIQRDERTVVLKCLLADSYFVAKDYEGALRIYKDIETNYIADLLRVDDESLAQGSGGYYAQMLQNLRVIYTERKDLSLAAKVNDRFLQLFPNDGDLTSAAEDSKADLKLQMEFDSAALDKSTEQTPGWRQIALIANIVIVIAILAAIVYIKVLRNE